MKPLSPYLKALKAFESAARLGSFSEAGKELFVTSAAVGQLVKQLETQLGTPLFHRHQHGKTRLALTEPAKQALPDIQAGFARLGKGLDKLITTDDVLTVATSPAFASKWLLPRIHEFYQAHPNIDVRLDTNTKPLDFDRHGIDVAVRYGVGDWADLTATRLFDETVFAVCSPAFLAKYEPKTLADLARVPMIYDTSLALHPKFMTWEKWLAALEADVALPMGLQINNSAQVLQMAMDGHGVALARSALADDDIKSGRLVPLFDVRIPSLMSYYLLHRPTPAPKVEHFANWLCQIIAQSH
ncbi:hypothetical protein B0181_00680 [Moraxella caviae]|uniref:Gcv operon activator n=1 Tax=Moraxella caviae TaxID=34060 RepID=A0A1T0ABX1_9GAMM|nr:LysR substrate-binding domain-containing protein [Moraxella caviae]OOR93192.1 hypothetical protein B0181_00680 [Moraxella caviae]STZ10463.1 Gcv operon activator [Moraxella caviae]VEW10674.1 Gcv operon activator [Moraxella caviae]